MEERAEQLIEQYLANDLTPAGIAEVENRLQTDMEFRKEFDEYKLAVDVLKFSYRNELKARFSERDKILDNRNTISGRNTRLLLLVGTIALLLLIWFFMNRRGSIEQEIGNPQDTLNINERVVNDSDTSKVNKQEDQLRAEGGYKEQTRSISDRNRGKELYAASFEPYMDDELKNVARGNKEQLSAYERFRLSYVEKEYESALALFNTMSTSMQKNDNLLFLKANALMALSKMPEAIPILDRVSKSTKTGYQVEALYYLALTELHRGNLDTAKVLLTQYVKDTRAIEKDVAAEILKDINKE